VDGVWEIDPGGARTSGTLVADGGDVWFAYERDGAVWVAKTSSDGESIVEPTHIDNGRAPAVDVQSDRLSLAYSVGGLVRVRELDSSSGAASGTDANVDLSPSTLTMHRVVAHADRTIVVSLADEPDVIATTVERDGTAQTVTVANEDGVAARVVAAKSQDRSLIAWDRTYDGCAGDNRPGVTLTSSLQGPASTTPVPVADTAGLTESGPAIASFEASAYVAWTVDLRVRSTISVARFDDVSVGVLELGDPSQFNAFPRLALATATEGAIAWTTYANDQPTRFHVASLRDDGTSLVMGPVHSFEGLDLGAASFMSDLVAVGGTRFVFGWTERRDHERLFARVVDLSEAPRLLPPLPPIDRQLPAQRRRPCSH
jgi:hypothetical protein